MNSIIPPAALTVVSLINSALSSAKTAKDLAKQSSDSDLKQQIGDVFDCILDIKERVLELDAENRSLRDLLKQKAAIQRNPQFGYYFVQGESDPLCPTCYEKDGKQIHLPASEPWSEGIRRDCTVCGVTYWEKPMNLEPVRLRTTRI